MTDSTLNVLLFAGRFEVRGSCAYILRLAEHLPELGIKAHIICSDARRLDAQKKHRLSITENRHLKYPVTKWIALQLLRNDLRSQSFDLIHIQTRSMLPQATWLARHIRIPYLLTVHDSMLPQDHLAWDASRNARIIAVSEPVREELIRRPNIPEEMVTVIRSGVEVPATAPAKAALAADHVPVIGTASPLEATKGLPFFLAAAQRILAAGEDVEFLVSGAGPEEGKLRRLARDLGIGERVTFVSNLYDFSQSLAAMDIFCLPSLRQGLGTIMLEAMAMARPVIASGVGGVYSVVRDNETGLMVPPSNSEQLANRILELLHDPDRARAIGERAREMVRTDFSVDTMVRQTAELYQKVIAENQPHQATKTPPESH